MTSTLKTLDDGRVFPQLNGETLAWSPGLYHTFAEEQIGFTRARAVLVAMRDHRPEQFERERIEMLKGSFDRMFGHNARKMLALIEEVQRS
jgi:hypothetical protein